MADPTVLDDVKVPNPEFFDNYDTGQFIPPPQPKFKNDKGKAQFVEFDALVPTQSKIKLKDDQGKWLKTAEGFLKAVIEGIVLTETKYEIQQAHVGTAQYKKKDKGGNVTGYRNSSPFGDYLRANGITQKPSTPDEYEYLAQATADRSIKVTIDWSAYDSEAKENVADKWEDFPVDPAGDGFDRQPFIEKNGKRYWARAGVKRWVSQVEE